MIRRGTFWITYLNDSGDFSPYLIYPYYPWITVNKPVFVNLNMSNGSDQMHNVLIIVVDYCVEVVDLITAY